MTIRNTTQPQREALRSAINRCIPTVANNSIDRALQCYVDSGYMEKHGIADIRRAMLSERRVASCGEHLRALHQAFAAMRAAGLNTGTHGTNEAIKAAHAKLDQFEEWASIAQPHIDVLRDALEIAPQSPVSGTAETHIVVTGNPIDGLAFFGPHATHEEAEEAAARIDGNWWIAELRAD